MIIDVLISIAAFVIGILIVFLIIGLKKEEDETEEIIEKKKKISLDILESKENSLKSMLETFEKEDNKLLIPIGVTEDNKCKTIDLKEISNLLVIGTTGGGKSILLNEIISSIALKYTKEEIKIVTLDTSLVELSGFNNIPHYLKETISNPREMMEELVELQRLINQNNESQPLLVIIDDFYDICEYDKNNIRIIADLLENGKSKDIYLILATDTPTPDVLTKEIKDKIQGKLYLTLAPGETTEFQLADNLNPEELSFLTEIGNLIYEENNKREKIHVPEVMDSEIKAINQFWSK